MTKRGVKNWVQKFPLIRQICMSMVSVVVLSVCGSVYAIEINTGNDDLVIRWDNTFRENLAWRLRDRDTVLTQSPNNNDGDLNFRPGGMVAARTDLVTETDVVYKKDHGIRLSAAAWVDPVYLESMQNSSPQTSNHFVNGQQATGMNHYNRDQYGRNAELMDAFAFTKIEVGDIPISLRVGRHTIFWGEAFFPYAGINGISYGQSPLDFNKYLTTPGVELKEIFRPLNQISATIQPTKEFSIAAQYYLQWESSLFPEGGSYLGPYDPFMIGGETALLPWGVCAHQGDNTPRQAGDWGIAMHYSPEALDATFGLYFRDFSDKLGQVTSTTFIPPAPGAPALLPTNYHFTYGSNIRLLGASFAKNILGISVGSEISYRWNMPVASTTLAPEGAKGETMHAVLNFLTLLPKTPLFDTGTGILEFTYGRWNKLTNDPIDPLTGAPTFNGRPGYAGADRVTRDNTTATLFIAPEWKQVFQSVDMSMPMIIASGLSGNSAVTAGGARWNGSYSAGVSAQIVNKYTVSLTYAGFFGTAASGGSVAGNQIPFPGLAGIGGAGATSGSGDPFGALKDRDLLSLTVKATF